eukprot:3564979-Alexandrium_andersonii.AAC.1
MPQTAVYPSCCAFGAAPCLAEANHVGEIEGISRRQRQGAQRPQALGRRLRTWVANPWVPALPA